MVALHEVHLLSIAEGNWLRYAALGCPLSETQMILVLLHFGVLAGRLERADSAPSLHLSK